MSELVGYARVSSAGQTLDVQEDALRAAGCSKVFSEKKSGASQTDRPELDRAVEYAREGDTFVVTRIDRLARSVVDLHQIVERLKAKGVGFRALQQGEFDTTTPHGALFLTLLGGFAAFERALLLDRIKEGQAKAKAEGRPMGRPKSVPVAEVRRLAQEEGLNPYQIQKRLGIGRGSVYRALRGDE